MRERLRASIGDRCAVDGGERDGGVINDAIDDHFARSGINRRLVGGDGRNFPGELLGLRKQRFRRVDFDVVG